MKGPIYQKNKTIGTIISIDNIGPKQDKFLNDIKKGDEIWVCERRLGHILHEIFPGYKILHTKHMKLDNVSMIPDYRIPDKNLIIEFDGYRHFYDIEVIIKDIKKEQLQNRYGMKRIGIPYFIQPTMSVLSYFFSKYVDNVEYIKDLSGGYPHGFVHPKSGNIGNFCYLGIFRTKLILEKLHTEVKHQIYMSLKKRSEMMNVDESILNPLLLL